MKGRAVAVNLMARVVIEETKARSGEAILLKGPSFANAFYGPDEPPRLYADVDLLVSGDAHALVAEVLRARGYVASQARAPGDHATTWRRDGLPEVDVHDTLGGLLATPDRVWATLREHQRPLAVAGGMVPVLDVPGLALHVAIHATQHGRAGGRPVVDLEHALDKIDEPDWRRAYELAEELEGVDAFATGLRLVPPGRELAKRLGIESTRSAVAAARAEDASGGAVLLAKVHDARGLRAQLRTTWWAIAPPPAVMRRWYPGRSLATAYLVWRPVRVIRGAVKALRELQVARESVKRRM